MADETITVVIGAKDEASKTIQDLAKKVNKLTKDPANLVLTSNATAIARDMAKLTRELNKLDAADPEVTVKANQLNALQGDLRQIEGMLRQINTTPIAPDVRGVDDLGRSAQSSRSALANMVGNSVQDLGQLSGVAGSAGVAVGQMGEFMADAALEGESLGKVIANFAVVAGPIAALSAGIAIVTSALQAARREQEEIARTSKAIADEVTRTFDLIDEAAELDRLPDLADQIAAAFLKEKAADLAGPTLKALSDLGIGVADLGTKLIELDTEAGRLKFFEEGLIGRGVSADIARNVALIIENTDNYQSAMIMAENKFGAATADFVRDHEVLLTAMDQLADSAGAFGLNTVLEGIRDRLFAAKGGIAAFDQAVRENPGADLVTVLTAAYDILAKMPKATKAAAESHTQWGRVWVQTNRQVARARNEDALSMEQWIAKSQDFARASIDAQRALGELVDPINRAASATDALSEAFDLDDHVIDTREQIVDVRDALRDLAEFIQRDLKGTIPNLLDPNDVNAGPYLDKFRTVRSAVQKRLEEVFVKGGPEAAKNWAERQITQIEQTLGGRLSREQIAELLGWEDLDVTVKVAVDKQSEQQAEALLDILRGLSGDTPWLAQVRLDLESGKLDPAAASRLIAQQLRDVFGIEVPAELVPNTADAIDGAQQFIKDHGPLEIGAEVASPKNLADMLRITQEELNHADPVEIPAVFKMVKRGAGVSLELDAGGVAGPYGGIVAEKRPEIIDTKYLVTRPTLVPPGTRVTSGARTARILRTRGTRGLKGYDSGGVVAGPQSVNINVSAAVIGNRYDVMRAVARAARDKNRLLGTRP